METAAWDNCHHILLQLQTVWAYWVVADFYHCLPLYNWVSSESCHRIRLQVQNSGFWGRGWFFPPPPTLDWALWDRCEGKRSLFLPLIVISVYGKLGERCWIIQQKCGWMRSNTAASRKVGLFESIGSWVHFVTTFFSRLGCLLSISSSSYRPVRSSGSWVIFLPLPSHTSNIDIDIPAGGCY